MVISSSSSSEEFESLNSSMFSGAASASRDALSAADDIGRQAEVRCRGGRVGAECNRACVIGTEQDEACRLIERSGRSAADTYCDGLLGKRRTKRRFVHALIGDRQVAELGDVDNDHIEFLI
jgi:hypothetical protein